MTRNRILVLLVEILIALALVGAVVLYADLGPVTWMPSIRWWGFAAMTAWLLWMVSKQYHSYWRRPSFWLKLAAPLAIHVCAWSVVLVRTSQWGLLWFLPPIFIEFGVLVLVMDKLGFGPSNAKREV